MLFTVFAFLANASAIAFAPPIFATKLIIPPIANTWRTIPAFHGSANEFNALFTKSKNACIKASNTLYPERLIKKLPDKIPINNEITTFFVIKANIIATNGGSNVHNPNLSAFPTTTSTSSANVIDVEKININIVSNNTL